MSTDTPYPGLLDRVVRVETRQDNTETTVAALTTTTAVHAEQMVGVKEDVREVKAILSNILRAIWALVLVLIPVAAGLIINLAQGG